MTDNAWAYKHSLREVCADRGGITQIFIKPHCPWMPPACEGSRSSGSSPLLERVEFTISSWETAGRSCDIALTQLISADFTPSRAT